MAREEAKRGDRGPGRRLPWKSRERGGEIGPGPQLGQKEGVG